MKKLNNILNVLLAFAVVALMIVWFRAVTGWNI